MAPNVEAVADTRLDRDDQARLQFYLVQRFKARGATVAQAIDWAVNIVAQFRLDGR